MSTPSATPAQLREALQVNLDKLSSEGSQRNCVVRTLAALGYRKAPSVVAGKMDGDVIRLYQWHGTPMGDVVLATGPRFNPKLVEAHEIQTAGPGLYILAGKDRSRAAERASALAEAWQPRAPRAKREAPVRVVPEAPRHVPAAARAPTASDERAELTNFLSSLLG